MSALKAYKTSPGLNNSTWYKGILTSQLAGSQDNGEAFDLAIIKMRQGTEPPPHVHSREHEFFYILNGEMRVYVGWEVFELSAGEGIFLPRERPHAFLLMSDEVHWIGFITPGGFFDAVNKMNAPAERMEVPRDADVATYANVDMTETMKVFEQYGLRFLTAEEIRAELPDYPL
jgi:quercetin dioxygenase-like cupin family protein